MRITDTRPTCFITVGYPGSGKTTWAKGFNMPVVDADQYRYVDGVYDFQEEREPTVQRMEGRVFNQYLRLKSSFINVETNLTRKRREKWAKRAHDAGFRVVVVYFPITREVSLARNLHGVGEAVLTKMESEFQQPDLSQEPYLDAIYTPKVPSKVQITLPVVSDGDLVVRAQ